MKVYRISQSRKVMYIMRGLPGSGKSSLAKDLGKGGQIFSADDYFMVNGKYQFDPTKLPNAHLSTQRKTENALSNGVSPIVVDNTNVSREEMKPYAQMAKKYGYDVEVAQPDTPWMFDAEKLAKRNKHGVPQEVIEDMMRRWSPNVTGANLLDPSLIPECPEPKPTYEEDVSNAKKSQEKRQIMVAPIGRAMAYASKEEPEDELEEGPEEQPEEQNSPFQQGNPFAGVDTSRAKDGPVEQYLKMIQAVQGQQGAQEGYHYNGPADFILKEGTQFKSEPLTEDEQRIVDKMTWLTTQFKMKECFYNAQSLAQALNDVDYVEGYLFSGFIPIEHGWNTINGKVIDFTMYHQNNNKPILGVIPDGWEYFGVPLPTDKVRNYWAEHGMSEPLIQNWREGYPMLKEPYKYHRKARNKNWYKKADRTNRTIERHVQDVLNADLSYPIFITENQQIVDGVHRTIKAKLIGQPVSVITLSQEELNQARLNPQNNYTGQVYAPSFDSQEAYSVKKLIELYGNKPSSTLDPTSLLEKNQDAWGPVSMDEVIKLAQQKIRTAAGKNWYKKANTMTPLEEAKDIMESHGIDSLNEAWYYLVDDRSHGDEFMAQAASDVYRHMFKQPPSEDVVVPEDLILEYMRRSISLGRKYLMEDILGI